MPPGGRLVAAGTGGRRRAPDRLRAGRGGPRRGVIGWEPARPRHGDTFIEATIGDIAGLIPNITSDGASHEVGNMIYDGLVKADKDLNFVGRHGGVVGVQRGLPRADLEAEAGHQVARRSPLHGRGRAVHLSGDDQSEDADGLQGGLPAVKSARGDRSLHVPRHATRVPWPRPCRAGACGCCPSTCSSDTSRTASSRSRRRTAGRSERGLSISGVEERREGRARLQQRVLPGPPVPGRASSTA